MPAGCSRCSPLTSSVTLALLFVFAQSVAATDQAVMPVPHPDLASIIQRLTQAQLENHNRTKAYSITREYKLFAEDATTPHGDIVATINFLPPNAKTYDIDQSTGGMGERVVRHILDHEVDVARNFKDMMVDSQNYDFELAGDEMIGGRPCYKLHIVPRHQRKELLKATMWVDKASYHILRVDGEPAKSPSFWVKDVHLVLDFKEVAGMWLQTETRAVARLRFGGEYKLTSHDLNYDVTREVAGNPHASRPRHRHSSAVLAASVD